MSRSRPQQALRAAIVVAVVTCAWILTPARASSQQLPFAVTVVDWTRDALARQRFVYLSEAWRHEVLFCVEKWRLETTADGYHRVVIERTRREISGQQHGIIDVGPKCRTEDGTALPMIHTHPDGNCQMSPADLVAIAARGAPFDGVQCGATYFVWAFAWQIKALAAAVSILMQPAPPPNPIP